MSQNSSKTMWTIVLVIIGGAVIGMFFLVQSERPVEPVDVIEVDGSEVSIDNADIDLTKEWVKGNVNAEHIIMEYSDFQCPACAGRASLLSSISKEFESDVAFVYRHFPLVQHLNAQLAAQAAEAAGMQGKFFEMHDMIFDNQAVWQGISASKAEDMFLDYAEAIGIEDLESFEDYMLSDEAIDDVKADYAGGLSIGINSTPTIFFDGQIVNNSHDHDAFRELIREALQNS